MKISIISDVHIKQSGDNSYNQFLTFLRNDIVKNSEKIFLLGDIFDLLCGPHEEYLVEFKEIFEELKNLLNKNVEIHYFEGNHDLHLKKLFQKFFKLNLIKGENFKLHTHRYIISFDNKKYYFSHGDDIELGNYSYKIYKRIIRSKPLELVANYLMPFSILDNVGKKASVYSRQKNQIREQEVDLNREAFRIAAMNVAAKGYDYIICGHNHVKDCFQGEIIGKKFVYLNNGHAMNSRTFIYLNGNEYKFIDI